VASDWITALAKLSNAAKDLHAPKFWWGAHLNPSSHFGGAFDHTV